MEGKINTTRVSHRFSNRLLACLLGITVVMAIVHLIFQYLNLNVYHELNGHIFEMSNRVDFDDEASIPTWFSQFILLSIAVGAFISAYLSRPRSNKNNSRIFWLIVGGISFLLSIDEVAALHEFVLQTVHLLTFGESGATKSNNAWVMVLPFITIGALALVWRAIRNLSKQIVWLFVLGGAIYLAGAVGIDIITNADAANNFINAGILVAIEESMELIGSSIILFAIIRHLELNHSGKIKLALKELRRPNER